MALWPPLDEPSDAVRDALASLRNGVSLAIFAAGNPFAVGAIIRVCHSFLVRETILVGTDPYYEKASMGMHRLEHVVRVADADELFAYARERPVWALERERARRSIYEVREFPPAFVLLAGSERFGIPPDVLARCDDVVAIPVYGVNNSLPVAVAVGIALSAYARVRYAAGTLVVGPVRER